MPRRPPQHCNQLHRLVLLSGLDCPCIPYRNRVQHWRFVVLVQAAVDYSCGIDLSNVSPSTESPETAIHLAPTSRARRGQCLIVVPFVIMYCMGKQKTADGNKTEQLAPLLCRKRSLHCASCRGFCRVGRICNVRPSIMRLSGGVSWWPKDLHLAYRVYPTLGLIAKWLSVTRILYLVR